MIFKCFWPISVYVKLGEKDLYTPCAYGIHMRDNNVSARVELDSYANKVLAVLKAKYGLTNKSEAINKFAEIYGEEIVEKDAKEKYVKKIIGIANKHLKRYNGKKMSVDELDALCEV